MNGNIIELCPICGGEVKYLFDGTVLVDVPVSYGRCGGCGIVRTQRPTWLDRAYANPIDETDVGLIARNIDAANLLGTLLPRVLRQGERLVDIAGGYGILVRLLRDSGFDAWWYDPYCENLFAQGFESRCDEHASVITLIEVIEHIYDPIAFLDDIMKKRSPHVVVFGTSLIADDPPPLKEWPYYAPETGQHVAFHTERSLGLLASRYGMTSQCLGWLRVFSPIGDQVVTRFMRMRADRRVRAAISLSVAMFGGRPSLCPADHALIRSRRSSRANPL